VERRGLGSMCLREVVLAEVFPACRRQCFSRVESGPQALKSENRRSVPAPPRHLRSLAELCRILQSVFPKGGTGVSTLAQKKRDVRC